MFVAGARARRDQLPAVQAPMTANPELASRRWRETRLIQQPYSGHASRTSLEIYSKIALGPAQTSYDGVIDRFPV